MEEETFLKTLVVNEYSLSGVQISYYRIYLNKESSKQYILGLYCLLKPAI